MSPLVHIFNISLSSDTVHDKLKIGKVVPAFKKGDRTLLTNYRSIC